MRTSSIKKAKKNSPFQKPTRIYLSIYVCIYVYMSYKTARVSNVLLVMVADRLWCILFCCIYIMIWNSCQGISTQFFFCEVGSLKTFNIFKTANAQVKNTAHAQNIFFYFFKIDRFGHPKAIISENFIKIDQKLNEI